MMGNGPNQITTHRRPSPRSWRNNAADKNDVQPSATGCCCTMTTRCARCRAGAARLVAPAGLLDRLLRLFFFLPFRCQVCTTRFHRFSIAAALQPQPEDKREYLRLLTSFQAVVAGVDGPAPARVVDLTVAGCGLE